MSDAPTPPSEPPPATGSGWAPPAQQPGWAAPPPSGYAPPTQGFAPPGQPPYPGYPPQQQHGYGYSPYQAPPKNNGMAIAALVCGIVGLLVFAVVLGPLAFIFGLVALNQIKGSGGLQKGRGMAIAGIVLGPIDIIAWLIVLNTLLDDGGF